MRCGHSIQNGQPNRKADTGLHDEVSDYGKAVHAETNGFTVTQCVVSSSLLQKYGTSSNNGTLLSNYTTLYCAEKRSFEKTAHNNATHACHGSAVW